MDKFKDREKAFEAEQSQKDQSEFDKRNSRNKVFAQYILKDIGQPENQELMREIILSDLEERLDEEYDIAISLASDSIMSKARSPFRTVKSLSKYVIDAVSN